MDKVPIISIKANLEDEQLNSYEKRIQISG